MAIQNLSEIKRLRKELKITQEELAKRSGVSQALIARIESWEVDPSYSKVTAIFEALESFSVKKEIKASEIMAKGVFGVNGGETVEEAANIMKKYKISQMPVFGNNNKINPEALIGVDI
jgi:predicted transcriptional regulator